MTDYNKQATDFLFKHSLVFSSEFLGKGKHFPDDAVPRNRYKLTLTRTTDNTKMSVDFGQSIVGTKENKKPTAYDMLACLTKNDPDTFENFCGDFGYDTDSRRALETYLSVQTEWQSVRRFFTAEELAEAQDIN